MVKLAPVPINALHKKPAPIERDTVLQPETGRACPGVGVISQNRIAPRMAATLKTQEKALLREIDQL